MRKPFHSFQVAAFGIGAALCSAVMADDHGRSARVPLLPAYVQECGACHTPYPPGMLPAASWRRLTDKLANHYGADASLDAETQNRIAAWLNANAGTDRRVREEPPADRITRSAWFVRKHDEVPAAAWQRPAIKTAANCGACHPKASQGEFNEHDIRIPR